MISLKQHLEKYLSFTIGLVPQRDLKPFRSVNMLGERKQSDFLGVYWVVLNYC